MTVTVAAGTKPSMAKRPTSIRGSSNRKTTAKTQNLNSRSVLSPPARCPPIMTPSRSTSPAAGDLSSFTRGIPETCQTDPHSGGMSTAAPIALQAPSSSIHPIGTRDCINCPMNIVRAKPEPYLEPIKLLNKQSIEDRQQNPAIARFQIGSVPFEKTVLKQQSASPRRSCYAGDRFPSASSRPIPPPKVLLKRHQSAREEIRKYRPSEKKATNRSLQQPGEEKSAVKRRELAYLIVDLQTGQSAISTVKNKRTLGEW